MGILCPEKYGEEGMNNLSLVIVMEKMEKVCV